MDNPASSAADDDADEATASSWSPSKWLSGLVTRQQPAAASDTAGPNPTIDVPITAAAASIIAAFPAATSATTAFATAAGSLFSTTIAPTSIIANTKEVQPGKRNTTTTKKKGNTKSTAAAATTPDTATNTASATPPVAINAVTSSPTCDWTAEQCYMVGLQPIKCQREGCEKFAHHFCSIEWASKNNLPEETIASLCRDHHLQYQMHVTAATAASDAIMKHPSPVAGTFTTSSPATAAAVAAAVAVFPSLTVDPGSDEMDVSGVSPDAQGKSPVFSTANKSNPKTATKKKMNKKGEMVDVVDKEARITKGI